MKTWMLLVIGVFIHTIFFYSIFDIYFTSPIVHGMSPHVSPVPASAKRLVLFSADGLRADKMLDKKGRSKTPYLRKVLETKGAWGVSHTHLPTESRPGHVAMIAGIYEDVSAVAKGWKENPVEFDSVFNQSRYTWSWGSPDILPMFAKGATGDHVFTYCYSSEFEDFGGSDLFKLDTWVFDKVKTFFAESKMDKQLEEKLQKDKVIFFLHLLGIDTNGHSKKPYSSEYLENIAVVDRGIQETVQLIEDYYNHDGRTAYIMTSDHGMTDWGSHGAGHPSETLTPLVVWGNGIRGPIKENSSLQYGDSFSKDWGLDHLRRHDVEQADVAPLMAAVLGINFPMNSVGVLPYDFLDISSYETAEVLYANTRQILEQYQVKMEMKKASTLSFAFRPFSELTPSKLAEKHRHIKGLIQNGLYQEAVSECEEVMQIALRGLNYYQTYDRFFLGTSIVCGFLGWMTYILTLIFEKHSGLIRSKVKLEKQGQPFWRTDQGIMVIFTVIGLFIFLLLFVQSLPWTNYLYCLIPVVLWMVVAQRHEILIQVYQHTRIMKHRGALVRAVLMCFVGLEILVVGFFKREVLTLGLLLMAVLPWIPSSENKDKRSLLLWSAYCMLLSLFPMLPVVTGKRHTQFVVAGSGAVLVWAVVSTVKYDVRSCWKLRFLSLTQISMVTIATYFSSQAVLTGLTLWQHGISWLILGSSGVLSMLGSTTLLKRLRRIFLAFVAPCILLSVSYEILFVVSLGALLYQWLVLECGMASKPHSNSHRNLLESFNFNTKSSSREGSRQYLVISDVQRAFYFIFLILISFFGTGNIASINSFDPASVLCFVSVFSPFIMGALLLFKIVIPFILVTCVLQAVHVVSRVPIQGLFLLILLMSDTMALHFFFLVTDEGSWLDIGTSISHYVIVMCMNIFIMLLYGVSHILTHWSLVSPSTRKLV